MVIKMIIFILFMIKKDDFTIVKMIKMIIFILS